MPSSGKHLTTLILSETEVRALLPVEGIVALPRERGAGREIDLERG